MQQSRRPQLRLAWSPVLVPRLCPSSRLCHPKGLRPMPTCQFPSPVKWECHYLSHLACLAKVAVRNEWGQWEWKSPDNFKFCTHTHCPSQWARVNMSNLVSTNAYTIPKITLVGKLQVIFYPFFPYPPYLRSCHNSLILMLIFSCLCLLFSTFTTTAVVLHPSFLGWTIAEMSSVSVCHWSFAFPNLLLPDPGLGLSLKRDWPYLVGAS